MGRSPHVSPLAPALFTALLSWTALAAASTFEPPVSTPLGNSTPLTHDIVTADVNHDGRPDIVVTNWVSNMMDVILALPGGGFAPVVHYPTAAAPYSVVLVDMNGDGNLDAVLGNKAGASVSVFLGDGAGGFGSRTEYTAPGQVPVAVVGDVTGDGNLDVVASADQRICVFAGDGAGHLAAPTSTIVGAGPESVWGIALGDLDHDGDLDIVANYQGPMIELRNDGSGGFTRFDYGAGIGARRVLIADINHDTHPDVVAASDVNAGVVVLTGDGTGALTQRPAIPTGDAPWHFALADLDFDGNLDAVVPNIGSSTLSIVPGTASGLGPASPPISTEINPIAVAVADLNGDGFPDIAETGYSGNLIIRYQVPSGGIGPSSVSLIANPSTAPYGADIALTASVTPSSATGTVSFLDGPVVLGVAPVTAGAASLTVDQLPGGTHSIRAHYSGDTALRSSDSEPISVVVTPAPTTTAIDASPNPAGLGGNVQIVATVVPSPPSSMDGLVRFRLDGAPWQEVSVNPVTGKAAYNTSTLSAGHHSLQASYEGSANHAASVSSTIDLEVVGPEPIIVSIRDVPNDQGGKVTIKWDSPADGPGSGQISKYRIWRRAAPDFAASLVEGSAPASLVPLKPPGATTIDYWEALADLPAEQLAHYAYTAPTTQDSLPGSNPYTAFFVSALTPGGAFFHSAVDSGYSVDNLAPPSPAPFRVVYGAGGNELHWTHRPTPDLREYRLYRGGLIDFAPGPENLIAVTRDTTLHDAPGPAIYKLVAVDLHGNVSRILVVSPDTPVGALASLTGVEVLADRIRLRWYSASGAGSPAALYRREADTSWERLASLSFDGSGLLTFEDMRVESGHRYGYRLGLPDGDQEVFTPETWTDGLPLPSLAMSLVSPNPSPNGRLVLSLSLPSADPAQLELVDVSGRRVAAQDVATGIGRHTVTLQPAADVRAGIYMLRLKQSGAFATRRIVVLP